MLLVTPFPISRKPNLPNPIVKNINIINLVRRKALPVKFHPRVLQKGDGFSGETLIT